MSTKILQHNRFFKKILNFQQISITVALLILFVIMTVLSPDKFFTMANFINVVRQTSTILIMAAGITFIIIIGGIDLSAGSIACCSGIFTASFLSLGLPTVVAILVGLIITSAIGLINGLVIAKLRFAPFIMTLATTTTVKGLTLLYCDGRPITGIPEGPIALGRGYIGIIPIPVIIMVILIFIMWITLTKTKFGKYVFAIGGNEECARLSGIKVEKIKILVYTLGGFCSGLTGILLTLRLGTGQPSLADGMELDAITAVAIGGTSMAGGRGSILGTILGCLFMTFLTNGLNVLGISSFLQQTLTGIILVIAVLLYDKKKK